MRRRAGICEWRVHAARWIPKTFRRNPGWLLRWRKIKIRRQGRQRIHHEVVVDATQEIPRRRARRLSICRSSIETRHRTSPSDWRTRRRVGARNYAVDDEKNALGESQIRRRNQIRGVDPRWETPPASFPRHAR